VLEDPGRELSYFTIVYNTLLYKALEGQRRRMLLQLLLWNDALSIDELHGAVPGSSLSTHMDNLLIATAVASSERSSCDT
jgi:hypothetical protein